MKNNLHIFNVTNKADSLLEDLYCEPAGVGPNIFPDHYINSKVGENIQHKDPYYAEYIFHYWFWKNNLSKCDKKTWIGFCQKRRFWLKKKAKIKSFEDLKKNILKKPLKKWNDFESVICKPINVYDPKKMKILKRGWKNLIKDPSIFYNSKKQNIKLHFDMHHGHGILDKAIDLLNNKVQNKRHLRCRFFCTYNKPIRSFLLPMEAYL